MLWPSVPDMLLNQSAEEVLVLLLRFSSTSGSFTFYSKFFTLEMVFSPSWSNYRRLAANLQACLQASPGAAFRAPVLKLQPAWTVLCSYTITSPRQRWETEGGGRERFVRSLSCLNTRLPGKAVMAQSTASAHSHFISCHVNPPFFKTSHKKLPLFLSLSIPLSGPDTWAPFPTSQLPNITANIGWWPEMPLFITRAGTHERAEISGCSISIVAYNNPSNLTVGMTASQHSHHAQFHRADTACGEMVLQT